jgi:hypothetical protein
MIGFDFVGEGPYTSKTQACASKGQVVDCYSCPTSIYNNYPFMHY